jgi:hypothetical protein
MLDLRNDHQAAAAKMEQMSTLKSAFGIRQEKEMGAAFDQELQEKKRLAEITRRESARKEEKRKIKEKKRKAESEALLK